MQFLSIKKLSLVSLICGFLFVLCGNAVGFSFGHVRLDKKMEDLVNSGIDHVKQVGNEQAYKDFTDTNGKFVTDDGKTYLFVYNKHGKCVAHGGNPKAFLNKDLISYKDKFGVKAIKMLIDIAKSGGGFAGYYWPNAQTGVEQFKLAYIKPLDNGDLIGTSHRIPWD